MKRHHHIGRREARKIQRDFLERVQARRCVSRNKHAALVVWITAFHHNAIVPPRTYTVPGSVYITFHATQASASILARWTICSTVATRGVSVMAHDQEDDN